MDNSRIPRSVQTSHRDKSIHWIRRRLNIQTAEFSHGGINLNCNRKRPDGR